MTIGLLWEYSKFISVLDTYTHVLQRSFRYRVLTSIKSTGRQSMWVGAVDESTKIDIAWTTVTKPGLNKRSDSQLDIKMLQQHATWNVAASFITHILKCYQHHTQVSYSENEIIHSHVPIFSLTGHNHIRILCYWAMHVHMVSLLPFISSSCQLYSWLGNPATSKVQGCVNHCSHVDAKIGLEGLSVCEHTHTLSGSCKQCLNIQESMS